MSFSRIYVHCDCALLSDDYSRIFVRLLYRLKFCASIILTFHGLASSSLSSLQILGVKRCRELHQIQENISYLLLNGRFPLQHPCLTNNIYIMHSTVVRTPSPTGGKRKPKYNYITTIYYYLSDTSCIRKYADFTACISQDYKPQQGKIKDEENSLIPEFNHSHTHTDTLTHREMAHKRNTNLLHLSSVWVRVNSIDNYNSIIT